MNYLVGDIIIRIKNAALARRSRVSVPKAKIAHAIAAVLMKEGFIRNIKEELVDGRNMLTFDIVYDNRIPLLTDVKLLSKPSLRVYKSAREVKGRGIKVIVVSTSKGVMTGKEASEKGLGGEALFEIW